MRRPDSLSTLKELLAGELDFQQESSSYSSHNYHSFPAKFPPGLPRKFILGLTGEGDFVLDPMTGSGTTLVEAHILNRVGLGFDIDPIATLLSSTKTSNLDYEKVLSYGREVLNQVTKALEHGIHELDFQLLNKWDDGTKEFVDYWFSESTQRELLALSSQIESIPEVKYRRFLEMVFSSIIITKSGGVSFAFDLGHTRPHRAKAALTPGGEVLFGAEVLRASKPRDRFLVKKLRSPLFDFKNKLVKAAESLEKKGVGSKTQVSFGNAESLPLAANSVDLVVTSPPYASNAIDYMRAHKFSLVWFGRSIKELGLARGGYIGGERIKGFTFTDLPAEVESVVNSIGSVDLNRAQVLRRYYSEMSKVLLELRRVLKPGSAAVVVVGNSIMKGISTQTPECLVSIAQHIGLMVAGIGERNIDRNRRMMPASSDGSNGQGIQQRMHKEYVLGFVKA